mgnify:CR=1 FL=1
MRGITEAQWPYLYQKRLFDPEIDDFAKFVSNSFLRDLVSVVSKWSDNEEW